MSALPAPRRPYRRRGEIISRRIAGECLLVPVRGELANLQRVYALNAVAERVWEALGDGGRSFEALVDAVEAGFEIDRETAARDLAELLATMEAEGLLEREAAVT